MSELNVKLDRRAFLKALAAAGVGTAFVAAVGPQALQAQGPVVADAPVPEFVASLTGGAFNKTVALATAGPGNNRNWQLGDSLKFLPPDKMGVGKYGDDFAALPKAKHLDMMKKMMTSRKWETTGKDLFLNGKDDLYGNFHMYIGEEAIAVGACAVLNDDDLITSTHRGHGHVIAKGIDINKASAEIFARTTGSNKAYGFSMHIVDMSKGIMGTNGIVGGGWLLAAGAALACKIEKSKKVAMCFAGDGAANSRYFFNALRNATLYKLPYISFIENNFSNAGTVMPRVTAVKYQGDLAKGLNIPCATVDGNDIAAVYAVTKAAVERARAGDGPSSIEAMTYRWYDHSGFSGAKAGADGAFGLPYRSDDEVRQWMTKDPIVRYKNFLIDRKISTAEEIAALDKETQAVVDASWVKARGDPKATGPMGLQNTWADVTLEATQFLDRKDFATTAWTEPAYLAENYKRLVLEA